MPGNKRARRGGVTADSGSGFVIPFSRPKSASSEEFWQACSAIQTMSERSSTMNAAVDAFCDGILSPGLLKFGTDEPASAEDTVFVRQIVTNLVIYGYSCYRRLTDDSSQVHVYQVPNGADISVRFDVDTLQWKPDFRYQRKTELTDTEDSEENDFRAIVLFPPLESRPDGYGARAFLDLERIEALLDNFAIRDRFNSRPSVFTFIDDRAFRTTGRANGQGWLSSGLDVDTVTGMEGATRSLSYNELIETRRQMANAAASATVRPDNPHFLVGSGLPTGLPGNEREDNEEEHREFVVTDGRKTTTAPQLSDPSQMTLLIARFTEQALLTMGVPAQALGKSVSAERVGSNARATTSALRQFEDRLRRIRFILPLSNYLEFGRRVDAFYFERLFPLLKTDRAIEVAAELFGVPATELDEEKVAAYQETMLGGQKSTTALQPETAKPISRRHKTEYEKELKEDSRAFRPS